MANGNIGDAPAPSFAEYVPTVNLSPSQSPVLSPTDNHHHHKTDMSVPDEESGSEGEQAPESTSRRMSDATRRRPLSRPTLAHRIYTQNLRVQANAKSLRARLLSGPLVNIYVGPSKDHWALHRNLLCHHSEYLSNKFLSYEGSKEPELKLELPEDDPAGFELLVKWLYQGKLDNVSDIADEYQKYEYAVSCHNLWLICDQFDMPQLKNMAVDQYRKGLFEAGLVPDADEINDIYRRSSQGSPFRRLMTKIAARQIMDPDTEKDAVSYRACFIDNPDFAIELVNAIKNDSGGVLFEDPTEEGDACAYHDHHDSPNCSVKGKSKQANIKAPTPTEARPSEATSANHPLRHSHPPIPDPLREKPNNNKEVPPTPPQTPPPLQPRRHASEILQRRTSTTSAASSGVSALTVSAHRRAPGLGSESSIEEETPPLHQHQSPHRDGIQRHQSSGEKSRRDSLLDAERSAFPWWAPRWQWRRAKSTSSVVGIR